LMMGTGFASISMEKRWRPDESVLSSDVALKSSIEKEGRNQTSEGSKGMNRRGRVSKGM
jgi:hypothetical protein